MSILIKYIIRQSLGSFLIGLGGFILFVSLELLYQLSDLIVRYKVGMDKLFILIYYNLPYFIVLGIPVGVLLAIFWTLSRMRSDNELIALQTHGVTLKTIVVPFVIFSVVLCIVAYSFNDFIVPAANRKASEAIAKYVYKRPEVTLKENAFMEDGRGRYLYIKRIDPETGNLQKLLLYDLSGGKTRVISAERASRESGKWIMHDGRIFETDKTGFLTLDMKFDSLELEFDQDISQYIRSSKSPREMTSSELRKKIESFEKLGVDTSSLQVALQEKISNSLAPFVIVLLGVPISLLLNLKSRSWSVILTFILVVIYQGSGAWLSAMGKENLLNPVLAPWIPNIIFTIFGIAVFALIDTRASYKLSEFLGRIFKISSVLLVLGLSTTLFSGSLKLSAGSVTGKANEILLTQGVQLSYTSTVMNVTVSASNASILLKDGDPVSIAFWGNVRISTGENVILAERAILELDREMIQALNAYTKTALKIPKIGTGESKSVDFFVYGEYVESTTETTPTIRFRDSSFTTCELEKPHYTFNVSYARLKPGEYLEVENLVMKILDVPVFYFPWYYFRLDDPQRRPFQIDLSSIGEGRTTVTLRYLKIKGLSLSFSWERNWETGADYFNFIGGVSTGTGEIKGLFQYSEDVITSGYNLGTYFLFSPKINGSLNIGGLYLNGEPSVTLKEPFRNTILGYKFVEGKKKAISPFDLQNVENLYLGTFDYRSSPTFKADFSFTGTYGLLTNTEEATYLWGSSFSIELPVDFTYTTTAVKASGKSGIVDFEFGRYYLDDSLKYYLNASASLSRAKLYLFGAESEINELAFTISSSSTVEGNSATSLLLPENIDEFHLSVKTYRLNWGNFSTSGDLEGTFDNQQIAIYTPVSGGKGKNTFTFLTKDKKFELTGNYALNYSSAPESPKESLFWIEPLKVSYTGVFNIQSDSSYRIAHDESWSFKTSTSISKAIPFLMKKIGNFNYKMNLTPSYTLDFEATDTSTFLAELLNGTPKLALSNELEYTPSASFNSYIRYNPTLDFKTGIIENPGKFNMEAKLKLMDIEYSTELDFNALFSDDATFIGIGELKTAGNLNFYGFEINHQEKTVLDSTRASETSFDVTVSYGAITHNTSSRYFWNEKSFEKIKNTETISYENERNKLAFSFEWQLTPDSTFAEDNPISVKLELELSDLLAFSFSMGYPFVYRNKIWPERILINFKRLKTHYFDAKELKVDLLLRDKDFDPQYPFPDRYFSEKFGTGSGRFYILDVESLQIGEFKAESAFLALKKLTDEPSRYTLSAGIGGLYLLNQKLLSGGRRGIQDYGLSLELSFSEQFESFQLNINNLKIGNSLLKHLSLYIGEKNYLEIGTTFDNIDWDTLYNSSRPLFIDLHCMALEGVLKLNFSGSTFSEIVQMVGVKYYIKALSDRYLVLGIENGRPYFKFRF
ncbi:LptF/LptG family permease [Kosmotoga pacifica]|uniref:LptF/LptG family permease n=1 Tax=Kosmotoga pacifica TaxID=1330330 RepID=UPI00069BCD9F|nr:LptF/LptG family permease [Kosmotoga pacifica]